jgi:hypothetical protein
MPYKYNEKSRHKIDKSRYKVTNWPEYNNALRKRGDFTVYFTEEAITEWHPAKTGSAKATIDGIETAHMIRKG